MATTQVSFDRSVFLKTLTALQNEFQLRDSVASFEADPTQNRFTLTVHSDNGNAVSAFGPCEVDGQHCTVTFDIAELQKQVEADHSGDGKTVTLYLDHE